MWDASSADILPAAAISAEEDSSAVAAAAATKLEEKLFQIFSHNQALDRGVSTNCWKLWKIAPRSSLLRSPKLSIVPGIKPELHRHCCIFIILIFQQHPPTLAISVDVSNIKFYKSKQHFRQFILYEFIQLTKRDGVGVASP